MIRKRHDIVFFINFNKSQANNRADNLEFLRNII